MLRPSRLGLQREVDLWHGALALVRDLPQVGGLGPGQPRDERRRELLLARVVLGRRVVVELAREGDAVLRRRQLLLELADVARGLELGKIGRASWRERV